MTQINAPGVVFPDHVILLARETRTMWISDGIIDATLLRLFFDRKVVGSQSPTQACLRRAWRKTGLRATDFDDALSRLESQGCLRRVPTPRGAIVDLLPEGEHRLQTLSATVGELGRWVSAALSARLPSRGIHRDHRRQRRTDVKAFEEEAAPLRI